MKKYIISLVISLVLVTIGAIMSVIELMNFDITDEFNNNIISKESVTYNFKTSNIQTEIDTTFTKEPIIIFDNNMAKGNIKIIVNYHNEIIELDKYSVNSKTKNIIYIKAKGIDEFKTVKNIFKVTIEGLKNKEIYDYVGALKPTVKVYINRADKDIVKIRK